METVMIARDELHELVDRLPENEVDTARTVLRYLNERASDPVLKALMGGTEDDEPETEEERAAVQEAREAVARGEVLTWEDAMAKLEDRERREKAS